jgi:uncharacterized membrane protein YccC
VRTFVWRIFRDATRIEPTGLELAFGLRCAVGTAIPLVAGLFADKPLLGVAAAIGAFPVGFASRQGVYRSRAAAALMTAAGVAVSAFVGAVCGGTPWAAVLVAALWGFASGVLASLGPSAIAVGVNSVVALAIFGQFHYTPAEAGLTALLVLSGGLLQTLLLVGVWPLERFTRERSVLGAAYRALGTYATAFPDGNLRAPDAATFAKLSETLADPQPFGSRGDIAAFEALLTEAERIRGTLAALATDRYLLAQHAAPQVADIERFGAAAAPVLTEIASALDAARAPLADADMWPRFDAPIAALEAARAEPIANRALGDAEALLGQLRSAWRAASAPAGGDGDGEATVGALPGAPRIFAPSAVREALATVRANLSLRSGFAQHGIRLAVVLAIATLAAHTLPLHRGYWVALTAALVLRNDFQTTFTRGVARIVGTLAGAVLASSIAYFVRPYPETLAILAVAFAFCAYAVFTLNYALFTLAITGFVVFMLALGGLPEHSALVDRVVETLIGGTLALVAYALWPTWERALAPERLAEMLDKQRAYAALVLNAYAEPERADAAAIHSAQVGSWLARTNAEASVDRMLAEPVPPRAVTVRAALGILAASRRFGVAALGLQARRARASEIPRDKLGILAEEIDASLAIVADALRRHADPAPLPELRDAQIALVKRLDATPGGDVTALGADTDLMVDSVNTMAHLLHKLRAGDRPAGAPTRVRADDGAPEYEDVPSAPQEQPATD